MALKEKFEIILPPPDIDTWPGFVRDLSAGDEKAFQWLYKNYARRVFDYALLVTQDTHLSEDIVQEVFLKLWAERKGMRFIENFNGWFYTIGRNCTLDKLRARQKEQRDIAALSRRAPEGYIDAEGIIHKEQARMVQEAVKSLSPQQQLAYTLKNELSWKRDRIAKELHISPHTVKEQLQRAVKAIRVYVSKRIKG